MVTALIQKVRDWYQPPRKPAPRLPGPADYEDLRQHISDNIHDEELQDLSNSLKETRNYCARGALCKINRWGSIHECWLGDGDTPRMRREARD